MDKIEFINTLKNNLITFSLKENKIGGFNARKNLLISNVLLNMLNLPKDSIDKEIYKQSLDINQYFVVLKRNKENDKIYKEKNGKKYIGYFHTKVYKTNFNIITIYPTVFDNFETSTDVSNVFKNFDTFVTSVLDSEIYGCTRKDFNIIEKNFLVFLLVYEFFCRDEEIFTEKVEKAFNTNTSPKIPTSYKKIKVKEFLEYINDKYFDFDDVYEELFIYSRYLSFIDMNLEDFEKWETEYLSHS